MLIKKITAIMLLPYVFWVIFFYQYHFIDGANLLFHEAGHLFLSMFGEFIHFLGGTLGQLCFPTICLITFLRQGQRFEAGVCGIWFGENVVNIAWYMGDAQAQVIPLVGGGIHDWAWLFSRMGILSAAKVLSGITHFLGAIILCGSLFFLAQEAFLKTEENRKDFGVDL